LYEKLLIIGKKGKKYLVNL